MFVPYTNLLGTKGATDYCQLIHSLERVSHAVSSPDAKIFGVITLR